MYISERLNDQSYNKIQVLYKDAFDMDHSIKFIAKKYDTSMFGLKNVGIIANNENGEPAAYYGVFPVVLRYESKDYIIAQSGDTMTSTKHRKKGLFVRLAQETYELSEELGIKAIFGFPNKFSYPGFKKRLNWKFADFTYSFTINNNNNIPFCELSSKYKFLENSYDKYAKNKISKYQIPVLEENISCFQYPNAKGQIQKDAKYFKYKMQNEKIYLIKVNGFTLLIKPKIHLYIGAIGFIDNLDYKILIKTIKKLQVKLLCKRAIITISKNHWLFKQLKKDIEPQESLPIGFYQMDDDINWENIQFELADYDTF